MNEKRNKRLMHIVKRVHGLLENDDLQKQRHSQNQLGSFFENDKRYHFTSIYVNTIHCEWKEYISMQIRHLLRRQERHVLEQDDNQSKKSCIN